MIAFGSAITKPDEYERFAAPGIRLAAEPDSEVIAHRAEGSIFRNYNVILDRAAAHDDLEALVLVHQDAEIVDPDFCQKLRRALGDPGVGVIGCVGAIGVRSIAWWEGSVTWASFVHRHGKPGEEFPSLSWDPNDMHHPTLRALHPAGPRPRARAHNQARVATHETGPGVRIPRVERSCQSRPQVTSA